MIPCFNSQTIDAKPNKLNDLSWSQQKEKNYTSSIKYYVLFAAS